jgi:hypothetical protein
LKEAKTGMNSNGTILYNVTTLVKGRYLCANKAQRQFSTFSPIKQHNIYIYPHGSEIWIRQGTILQKREIESRGTRNTMCGDARRPFKGTKGEAET